jgi:hypothetical protein
MRFVFAALVSVATVTRGMEPASPSTTIKIHTTEAASEEISDFFEKSVAILEAKLDALVVVAEAKMHENPVEREAVTVQVRSKIVGEAYEVRSAMFHQFRNKTPPVPREVATSYETARSIGVALENTRIRWLNSVDEFAKLPLLDRVSLSEYKQALEELSSSVNGEFALTLFDMGELLPFFDVDLEMFHTKAVDRVVGLYRMDRFAENYRVRLADSHHLDDFDASTDDMKRLLGALVRIGSWGLDAMIKVAAMRTSSSQPGKTWFREFLEAEFARCAHFLEEETGPHVLSFYKKGLVRALQSFITHIAWLAKPALDSESAAQIDVLGDHFEDKFELVLLMDEIEGLEAVEQTIELGAATKEDIAEDFLDKVYFLVENSIDRGRKLLAISERARSLFFDRERTDAPCERELLKSMADRVEAVMGAHRVAYQIKDLTASYMARTEDGDLIFRIELDAEFFQEKLEQAVRKTRDAIEAMSRDV